jgi:aspartyl-tRNA(Asn)/glutamyl-tRNA(Gln) amidotransferase subunit A
MMADNDIISLSLCDVGAAIKRRELSSVEVTRACLEASEKWQSRINCFISIDGEAALMAARVADNELAKGFWRGPLHGVPMAHKDMFYRKGNVSTCGSKICARMIADRTATVHERLDTAGAVYLGGLNMSEFAAGPTGHNEYFGHCRNPWNSAHVSGGSSSGSGAAVAARLVFGSMGSDTGGSIRLPAAMCGVVGLKPTYGLISRYGIMPRCWSLDVVGPLARTVKDCAVITRAVAGQDERDPTSASHPVPDYESGLNGNLSGLRIGVPDDHSFGEIDSGVKSALEESRRKLELLGAQIVEIELPDTRLLYSLTNVVNKVEAATIHAKWIRTRREDYSLSAINRMEAGFYISATHYLDAVRSRGKMLAQFVDSVFVKVDAVHMPVLSIVVPTIEETEIRTTDKVPELIERITRFTRWVNYLGLPALSVPCGFTENGLPVSFQLLGRPFSESLLFRVGDAFQRLTDWHLCAPTMPQSL